MAIKWHPYGCENLVVLYFVIKKCLNSIKGEIKGALSSSLNNIITENLVDNPVKCLLEREEMLM